MKHAYILVIGITLSLPSHAQHTSIQDLNVLDEMINNPSSDYIFTDRAFDKFIYQDQQAIGGAAIKEGKVVGTSATVDEKSLTLNVGSNIMYRGNSGFVVQGILKGQAEEGFVNVFSAGDYAKTLGYGGSVLWFLPWARSFYYSADRVQLHGKLRKLRNEEGQLFPNFGLTSAPGKPTWDMPTIPKRKVDWDITYIALLEKFASARRAETRAEAQFIADSTAGRLSADEIAGGRMDYPAVRKAEAAYQSAEAPVTELLPKTWRLKTEAQKDEWVDTYVDPNDHVKIDPDTRLWLLGQWGTVIETIRQKRLKYYDSLQMITQWSLRYRQWFSLNGLVNVASQPVFDISNSADGYKRTYQDTYFDGLLAYNGLLIHAWGKQYFSLGGGINTMRVFEKSNRRTYQATTWQLEGTDSVQVVKQSEAYPTIPDKPFFKIWQAQYSLYSSKLHIGMDLTARGQYAHEQAARHKFTFGVFIPIQAGETTLLFMPQVRWANADQPHPFTFGFNLSASIPGFVTKDKIADKK